MKFTLRDLFWLMLVVAMACAWWVNRRGLIAEKEAAANRAEWDCDVTLTSLQDYFEGEGYTFDWSDRDSLFIDGPHGSGIVIHAPPATTKPGSLCPCLTNE